MLTNSTSLLEICHKLFRSFLELFQHTRIMNWIKDYFCVGWAAAVITGFACTHWFVRFGALGILVSYFEYSWEKDCLPHAAGMVNLLDGLSAMLGLLTPFICTNQDRRLKVIICSTVAYIVGMGMLCFSAFHRIPADKTGMYFVPAVVLISVGNSGGMPVLGQLLAYHLLVAEEIATYQSTSEGRVKAISKKVNARMKVWWTTSEFVCNFLAPLVFSNANWEYTFISSTSAMLIGFLLFLCFTPLYHRSVDECTTTEISCSTRSEIDCSMDEATTTEMFDASHTKNDRSMDESTVMEISLANLKEHDRSGEDDTTTKISHASPTKNDRSVDEATITYISHASPRGTMTNDLVVWARSQEAQWKPLYIMIPIWITFLVSGLLSGIGNTFFFEQVGTMSSTVAPIYYLYLVRGILIYGSYEIHDLFLSEWLPKPFKTQGIKVGIWTAMVLSVFCCSVAWRVEVHRLHIVAENTEICDEDIVISMSSMWLVPQFCLLGLMEGIGQRSLNHFVGAQFSDVPVILNGITVSGAVIGFGSFINGLLVHLVGSWFNNNLNCSRLDKYYQMLTVLTFVNLCYYWFVSTCYFKKTETKEDVGIIEILVLPMDF